MILGNAVPMEFGKHTVASTSDGRYRIIIIKIGTNRRSLI